MCVRDSELISTPHDYYPANTVPLEWMRWFTPPLSPLIAFFLPFSLSGKRAYGLSAYLRFSINIWYLRVYLYTKVSPIVLSQEDSPERRISWGEPLLFAQISFIFRYFSAKNIFTFFLHLTGRNKQPNSVSHEF